MDQQQLLDKLIETFEKWNEDLKQSRDDYKASSEALELARQTFVDNSGTESWSDKAKKLIVPFTIIAALLVIAAFVITGHCGSVGWGDYNISIVCPIKR